MLKPLLKTLRTTDAPVWRLAAAETIVWAGMFYLFPALMLHWERDQLWAKTDLSLAITMALVVSALGAPHMGRLIDRGHGRLVLALSALLGGATLAALSTVDGLFAFYVLWVVAGIAMAGCLYEPCFAYIIHSRPDDSQRAITVITLAAGFASTIAFPVVSGVAEALGWRASMMLFAVLIVCIAVPLFWFGASAAYDTNKAPPPRQMGRRHAHLFRPEFWLLTVAFVSTGLTHGMLISHLLPILDERGVEIGMAVLTASLIGPMQVVGRIFMTAFEHRVSIFIVMGLSFVFMTAGVTTLYLAGSLTVGLVAFSIFQGSGYGVTSITKPMVTRKILGRENFGVIAGALAMPYMMAYAFAPSLAAFLWSLGGYDLVLGLAIALPVLGGTAFKFAVQRS